VRRSNIFLFPIGAALLALQWVALSPTLARADITTDLVAHWEFEEGTGTAASDSSGNGNGGTLTNSPTWAAGTIGDTALEFDGADDYVEIANESNFDFEHTDPFSVAGWAKFDPGESGQIAIFNKSQQSGNQPGIDLRIDAGNRLLRVYLVQANGSAISVASAVNSLTPNTWHHVALTYDGSSSGAGLKVYIDGEFIDAGSGTLTQSILNDSAPFLGKGVGASMFFNGTLDDVRVYSRELSDADVSELNTVGLTVPGAPTAVTAVKGNAIATVSFTAPADNGGSAIIRYTATSNPGGVTATSTASPITVSGLTNDTEYTFTVTATNILGTSTASTASNAVTPDDEPNVFVADTCGSGDVQAAMDQAVAGDIVEIPAGTCTWTENVAWDAPANVTLRGAGTSATGGGDQTVIIDGYEANDQILSITVASTGLFRMTGITFETNDFTKDGGAIEVYGPGNIRIDHCHLVGEEWNGGKVILLGNGIRGVMDHCVLDLTDGMAIYMYNGRVGEDDIAGNYEWTQPTAFGTSDYFFIEDNVITGHVSDGRDVYGTRIWDGFSASKVVVRFNDVQQACLSETHDTGHSGDDRGTRSQEAYGNLVTSDLEFFPNFTGVTIGGGTALVWGNSWDNVYKSKYRFNVTRKNDDTYAELPTPNGWGYAGTAFNGTGSNWDGNEDVSTGYPAIDQPGRGIGDLLTGYFPNKVNDTTGTIAWPNQALEPIYLWDNYGDIVPGWGDNEYSNVTGGRVQADRDYYAPADGIQTSPTSPFDGTTGTGWGTLANRPTTCTAGVGYFATDQGSWNTSESNEHGVERNGDDGVLYKCSSTDTWSLYYTPYTYPHPLISGAEEEVEDTTDPSVSLTAPADNATVSGAAISVTASASDNYSVAGVRFWLDGTTPIGAEDTVSSYGVTWDTTGVADGAHTLIAVARDVAGNRATSTAIDVTVANDAEEDSGEDEEPRRRGGGGGGGGRRSADTAVATSSPARSGSFAFARDLDVGASGEDVRQLQILLNARGFAVAASGPGSAGQETTLFGGLTRAALARFQAANGVSPALGYFGPRTRAALGGAAAPAPAPVFTPAATPAALPPGDLQLGSRGAQVLALQRLLVALDAGPAARALAAAGPSGNFGALTQAAVIEIQTAKGISPASGYFGPRTRAALGL
jgi:hypothetical protein